MPDVPENALAPTTQTLFAHWKEAHSFKPVPTLPPESVEWFEIEGRLVNTKYLLMIAALPEAEIAAGFGTKSDPLPFRFANGVGQGLVMPKKRDAA